MTTPDVPVVPVGSSSPLNQVAPVLPVLPTTPLPPIAPVNPAPPITPISGVSGMASEGTTKKSSRNLPIVVILIIILVLVGLGLFSVYLLTKQSTPTGGTCLYNGQTYNVGDSYKSQDGCNSCSCTATGSTCTLMACVSSTPAILPSAGVSGTPATDNTPAATNPVSIYFGKPTGEADYTTVTAVTRNTDVSVDQQFSYIISQILSGPTADEKTAGFAPVMSLSGTSTCSGSSYKYVRVSSTLTVTFCKTIAFTANTGTGGAFAGMGLQANARVYSALASSLKIDGVSKVVIKNSDGSCFAMDSGVNADCTP